MKIIIASLMICLISIVSLTSQTKIFSGATLVDPKSGKVIENSLVLVEGNKIISVGDKLNGKIPQNYENINLDGKFIIPAFTDGHIHFFQSGGLYTRPDAIDLRHRISYENEINWIKDNIDDPLMRYIKCGVTNVVDAGGPYWIFDVKKYSKNSEIAPRVYCTGPLISSYSPKELQIEDLPIIKVNNSEEAIQLVNKIAAEGADFIKVWYIVNPESSALEQFEPIYKSIVSECRKLGLRVFTHATELATAKKAMQLGCDVLVHMVKDKIVDDEFIELALNKNVIVIPTLYVFESYKQVFSKNIRFSKVEHFNANPYTIGSLFDMHELTYDELGERQRKILIDQKPIVTDSTLLTNLLKIYNSGITIAMGTDAGNIGVLHGPSIFREFKTMAKSGIPIMDLLKFATINGAKLIGRESEYGSFEKGKIADFIVLNKNPLEHIDNLDDILFTVKDGVIYETNLILPPSPEDLAQIQLNAYNSKDLKNFLLAFSDNVEIYEFPNKLLYKGKDTMYENYKEFFDKATQLHCKLLNRITIGNKVIDREYVTTGITERNEIEATAIYEVENSKIIKVWFIR